MTNLFEAEARKELGIRLGKLNKEAKPLWGMMTADQMLRHCNRFLDYTRGGYTIPDRSSWFMKVFIKPMGLGKIPYPKAKGDTMPEFKSSGDYNFESEKEDLIRAIEWFAAGGTTGGWPPHPLFGAFAGAEWARIAYKHTDHHLRQFGV